MSITLAEYVQGAASEEANVLDAVHNISDIWK